MDVLDCTAAVLRVRAASVCVARVAKELKQELSSGFMMNHSMNRATPKEGCIYTSNHSYRNCVVWNSLDEVMNLVRKS